MSSNAGGSDRNPFHGQVAVVTGAGRGIGRETARVLAGMGARVVVAELAECGAETAECIRVEGGEALFVQTDVADEVSVAHLFEAVKAAYGRADILINNAVTLTAGRLWEHTVAEWDRVMAVNLRGAFLCIKAFLPDMLARKNGVVVTMESADGMPYLAPYLATKAGLRSLALSLAAEVPADSGVSVFCFAPGMVETPGLSGALEKLPSLYGVSHEEFIRHSGGNLVSPETCAKGLAGTILHASEFHGQEAGFAEGLRLLGLNAAGERVDSDPVEHPALDKTGRSQVGAAHAGLQELLERNRKLEAILQDNIREYSELTLFQRPIVRRMFQQGTGLKVEEWLALAQAMSRHIEASIAGEAAWMDHAHAAYIASLERLDKFILKQESDAQGFFRDKDKLQWALEALRARRAVVTELTVRLRQTS